MHLVRHKLADSLTAIAFGLVALGMTSTPAAAQRGSAVPNGYEPPRGMCRVWIEGVPAAQQPAPTDCATAIRKRPSNGTVIFGQPVRTLEEADRLRDQLPAREYWSGRDSAARPQRARSSDPANAPRPSTSRGREATPPRGPDRAAPRARREAPTQGPPRARAERPAPQPTPRAQRTPPRTPPRADPGRSRAPSVELQEDLLSRELWMDSELLASLYGESPPGAMGAGVWPDDGRAALPGNTGERGRGVYGGGANGMVPWALSSDGRMLSARDVEARVRGELAMLGGAYGYGAGYGGYGPYPGGVMDPSLLEPRPGE